MADGDVGMLEDLILAALRDATSKLIEVRRSAMGQAVGGALSAMLGGESADDVLGPGLSGLFGGSDVVEAEKEEPE